MTTVEEVEFLKKRHHRRLRLLALMVLLFFFLMSHAFLKFEKTFFGMQLSQKQEELEKTAEIKAESIQKKYETMISSLQALAENMNGWETIYEEEIMQQLVLLAKVGYFDYVGISDADGNMIDSNSQEMNIKNREYFRDAMGGKISISDVLFSKVRKGEEVQVIAVPIPDGDRSIGVVFGIVNVGTMDKLLENETGTGIYTQIVDSQGNYITNVKTKDALIKYKNVWDDFAECEFLDGSIEKIRKDMQQKESGSFSFRMGKEERVSFYTPLGVKGYYVFSSINSDYIREWVDKTNEEVLYMVLEMGAAFFLLLIALFIFNKKVKEELQDSHAEAFSSVELMKIAIQQSKQFVFEYDRETKELRKKAGIGNSLFSEEITKNLPEAFIENGVIEAGSVKDFREIFEKIEEEEIQEKVIRVNAKNGIQWFKMIVKNIYNDDHQIMKTVGIVDDITEKKVQEELLEEGQKEKIVLQKRAERDGLTGLYNAATVKQKIHEFLNSPKGKEGNHLLLLMDIDNFKQINDTFGHRFGDQVLKDISGILQKKFRRDDILGRLGGDEFVVFMINAAEYEIMEPVLADLCRKLKKTYTKDGKSVTISASFGIVEAPKYGKTFHELYEKSDRMLYEVKKNIKNGFKNYREESEVKR